jgi:putative ABC transport system substrate-binding protein
VTELGQARLAAFLKGLQQSGWTDGNNVRIEHRWGAGDAERTRKYAAERRARPRRHPGQRRYRRGAAAGTRTVPIIFTIIADPVGTGIVESLAHPGGNATGFTSYEYGFGAKWLELLKEIAPSVK